MKPISFQIPQTRKEVFRVQAERLPYFYDKLHQHKEVQFTLIKSGEGTLVAGDYVGRFAPGDVFVIGKQLPHVFRCDSHYFERELEVASISIFFDESYAGKSFWKTDEMGGARHWLAQSGPGYVVEGTTQKYATVLMVEMEKTAGMDKLIKGFGLLKLLCESKELQKMSLQDGDQFLKEIVSNRMDRVMGFSFQEYHRTITIEEVAALVSLTPSAFCRFFKLRTRKTYLTFLNEIRLSQACSLLITTDLAVSEICFQVGFNSLSHFNQSFRRLKGCTPTFFRQAIR